MAETIALAPEVGGTYAIRLPGFYSNSTLCRIRLTGLPTPKNREAHVTLYAMATIPDTPRFRCGGVSVELLEPAQRVAGSQGARMLVCACNVLRTEAEERERRMRDEAYKNRIASAEAANRELAQRIEALVEVEKIDVAPGGLMILVRSRQAERVAEALEAGAALVEALTTP